MSNNLKRYYSYRLELKKLKYKTWILVLLTRLILLLALLVSHYIGRD